MNRNETNDDAIREGEPPYRGNTDSGGGARPIRVGGEPMRQRSRPCWNIVSVLAPFAGLVLAIPFGLWVVSITESHPAAMAKPSASFFAVSAVVGLLSGCIALARSERLWGISIVGLAVNAAILALLVYSDPWSGPF
jgi:hypothetical protein